MATKKNPSTAYLKLKGIVGSIVDLNVVRIVIKGTLTMLAVYFLLLVAKKSIANLSDIFGYQQYSEELMEWVHVRFTHLAFIVSCVRDLRNLMK